MSRIASRYFAAVAVMLLFAVSGSLLGQAPPTPGPGPWSLLHPIWFDSFPFNGIPDPGELAGHPSLQTSGCTRVVGYPPTVIGPGQSPCTNVSVGTGVTGSLLRPSGVTQRLSSNAAGTTFTFSEEFSVLPPIGGGTGQLLDLNGDGIFDALQVQGTTPSHSVPQTLIGLVPRDVTGDGRPDYITLPWLTGQAGLIGVDVGFTPQIYIPLTDTNLDGWPDTITVQVANGGISTTTGPPLSGPALGNGAIIPSTSTLGLFVFAAAVVALGVKLLRGAIVAS